MIRPAGKRFLLEAEITGGLEHPESCRWYGLASTLVDVRLYAMRFLRGDSLKTRLPVTTPTELSSRPGPAVAGARQLLRRFVDVCHAINTRTAGRSASRLEAGEHHRWQARRDAGVDWGLAKAMGRSEPGM